jgi:hypothetical protein
MESHNGLIDTTHTPPPLSFYNTFKESSLEAKLYIMLEGSLAFCVKPPRRNKIRKEQDNWGCKKVTLHTHVATCFPNSRSY